MTARALKAEHSRPEHTVYCGDALTLVDGRPEIRPEWLAGNLLKTLARLSRGLGLALRR